MHALRPVRGVGAWSSMATLVAFACGCSRDRKGAVPLVYASDEESGAVVAIDPSRAVAVARIPVGSHPREVKMSRDGARLYVALSASPATRRTGPSFDEPERLDHSTDGIGVVDLAKRELVMTLPSGPDPAGFDITPDGRTLFASNGVTARLSAVDLLSGKMRGAATVGVEPEGVAVRPDGKVVFVASEHDGEVSVVDVTTLAVTSHIPAGRRPRTIVFSPDGATAFVTDEAGARVMVLDAVHFAPLGDIPVHEDSPMPSGPRPMGEALSPDGKLLYVTCGRGGSVAVIDVATRKQVRSIDGVGDRPWGIAQSADGAVLFTANGTSHDVSVVDVASGNVERRVTIGGAPWGIAAAK